MRRVRASLTCAVVVVGSACGIQIRHVDINASHPTRAAAPETPATLPHGNTAVMVSPFATTHSEVAVFTDTPTFKMSNIGATARIRHGLATGVDIGAEGHLSAFRVRGSECDGGRRDKETNALQGSGRFGFKFNPKPIRKFLAFSIGAGGGHTVTGPFLGPDASVSFGYENPYAVPFISTGVIGSFPIPGLNTNLVDCISQSGDALSVDYHGQPTLWWATTAGVKAMIPEQVVPRDFGNRYILPMIYVAATFAYTGFAVGGVVTGIEIAFGKTSNHVTPRPGKPNPLAPPEEDPVSRPPTTSPPPPAPTPTPQPQPQPELPPEQPEPQPTPEPQPQPTPDTQPQPTPDTQPQPTPQPTPTPKPTPPPVQDPTPPPQPEPTPKPDVDPNAPVIQRPKGRGN